MLDIPEAEIIRKRKSIRKYQTDPLDADTQEKVREQIMKIKPLYPSVGVSIDMVEKTKGMFGIKAPHYLVFRSKDAEGALENIGFIGQQMDLFFSAAGIGACWLGASKPANDDASALPCVICMAYGKPAEPLHRGLSAFKRKAITEISEGEDERLEAARLAPSAMNAQNWFFASENGEIHCYRKKANPLVGFIYDKLHSIDMGIALCHIAAESDEFSFAKESGAPERQGYVYMGTAK